MVERWCDRCRRMTHHWIEPGPRLRDWRFVQIWLAWSPVWTGSFSIRGAVWDARRQKRR
jgi:hypothetical protein